MRAIILARKGQGIERVIDSLTPRRIEEFTPPKVENGLIAQAFGTYLAYLQDENCYAFGKVKYGLEEEIYERVKSLDAQQVSGFLETVKICESFDHHKALFPYFLDVLIQKSYDGGHNDFTIHSSQLPEEERTCVIFSDLKGKKENPLRIKIRTQKPHLYFGFSSETGSGMEYCSFDIYGNITSNTEDLPYGDGAKYCTYVHHGILKLKEPDSMNDPTSPENCTFKTTNKRTLQMLQQSVPGNYDNQIYFIDRKGREKLISSRLIRNF